MILSIVRTVTPLFKYRFWWIGPQVIVSRLRFFMLRQVEYRTAILNSTQGDHPSHSCPTNRCYDSRYESTDNVVIVAVAQLSRHNIILTETSDFDM